MPVLLQGCVSPSAEPHKYMGQYFMVGDSNCRRFNHRSYNTINCFDYDGVLRGYRAAMTDQDMQMYIEKKRQNDRSADKRHDNYCSLMPPGTYGCN